MSALLSDAFLARLSALTLCARAPSRGLMTGQRKSRAKGSSVEFSDFREYAPGDDVRRIDWNAYARLEKLMIKLFMEERETQLTLLLDDSASMDAGEPSKFRVALELAAALSYLALMRFDRVTILSLSSGARFASASGRRGFMAALEHLSALAPAGRADLNAGLKRHALPRGHGLCVLLSDLFFETGYEDGLTYLAYLKQEVSVLQLLSPGELAPALEGNLRLNDSEGGGRCEVEITPAVLRAYAEVLAKFQRDAQAFCLTRGMPFIPLNSATPVDELVFGSLASAGLVV